ncbi:MAG TPA: Asp-tRNA(Asn)/Glu-tRNA(Gln) amidotransferase subunit GatB [Desulfotignum sp.]|nr:Asp-tRNA(Asn)/Glu-tRNA(Gln) amidotransferase subunit GatB [Desulfotignum sp.]
MTYEAVIGLEIHVELNTPTKLFCDCPNDPGNAPNTHICPTCLWLPGALPQLSRMVVEKAVTACLALNCTIQTHSAFDQKVYYYPDLPKGYQLSQHHRPLARNGYLDVDTGSGKARHLRIHHVHLEEDVAKLIHETEDRTPVSLVDFNRAGVPLIEIVTEPDIRTPEEAMAFLKLLRTRIRYTGSSECSLEKGSMRVDANISIRPEGSAVFNTKVEVKNMNSIQHVGDAVAYEIQRQTLCIEKGDPVVLHTRLWDPDKQVTAPMRDKFAGPCIPDPSVPAIVVEEAWLAKKRAALPEMPDRVQERFVFTHGLARDEAKTLSQERDLAQFFETVAAAYPHPRKAATWIISQLVPAMRDQGRTVSDICLTPDRFIALLGLLDADEINAAAAKAVLVQMLTDDRPPKAIVDAAGFRQVSDTRAIEEIVNNILAEHPSDAADYRAGNLKVMGFFMGQAMKAAKGKANPKVMKEILTARLSEPLEP